MPKVAAYPENMDLRRTMIRESLSDMLILSRGWKKRDALDPNHAIWGHQECQEEKDREVLFSVRGMDQ